jgi:hypothetical protein
MIPRLRTRSVSRDTLQKGYDRNTPDSNHPVFVVLWINALNVFRPFDEVGGFGGDTPTVARPVPERPDNEIS